MGLSFEQIVKRSTKPMNQPKGQPTPASSLHSLSPRERKVIRLFRVISEYEKRTVLALLKTWTRHTDGPTPKE